MNDNKNDCVESITHELRGKANWRKATAVRFPDDHPRNIRAADALDKLADDFSNLTDEQWQLLKPYYGGWHSETWRAGLSLVAKQVGFLHRARDLDSFISILIRQLSQSVAA
jgi:hypothetical protein